MLRYSAQKKRSVIEKLLPPNPQEVKEVAKQEGVSVATVYKWRKEVFAEEFPEIATKKSVAPIVPESEPIHRRKLFEDVSDKIESWIRSGHFREGDRLPSERELMATLGVGRTSIREALFALHRTGMVDIRNGSRAVVSRPNPRVILNDLGGVAHNLLSSREGQKEFQQARLFWEASLVRYAASQATGQDIAKLEALLRENELTLHNLRRFTETDVAFHDYIATIPQNSIFTAVNVALGEWLAEQRSTSLLSNGAAKLAYKAHCKIFEAIKAGDPDAAEAAMKAHLEQVTSLYWKVRG